MDEFLDQVRALLCVVELSRGPLYLCLLDSSCFLTTFFARLSNTICLEIDLNFSVSFFVLVVDISR